MGLEGSTRSECLSVVTCDFEPPEHVSRTSVRAHICTGMFGRTPCVPRCREHEKRPAARREKHDDVQKNVLYIVIQGSPSGCVRREIPGVAQVDEKGHEGDTAVVTSYVFL